MVAGEDDVVVADGLRQEVARVGGLQLQDHLRAAQVLLILVAHQRSFRHEMAPEVAGDFEDGHGAFRQFAVDAHADPGLEMGVEGPVADHIERHGAMGKQHFPALGVDARRVGLEARPAGQEFTLTVYSNATGLTLYKNGTEIVRQSASGDPTGVIWSFPVSMDEKDTVFEAVSEKGTRDRVTFKAL